MAFKYWAHVFQCCSSWSHMYSIHFWGHIIFLNNITSNNARLLLKWKSFFCFSFIKMSCQSRLQTLIHPPYSHLDESNESYAVDQYRLHPPLTAISYPKDKRMPCSSTWSSALQEYRWHLVVGDSRYRTSLGRHRLCQYRVHLVQMFRRWGYPTVWVSEKNYNVSNPQMLNQNYINVQIKHCW